MDSNVVAYLYLPGVHTLNAEALFQRDSNWAAPLLWRSEFRNILAGCMRPKSMTFDHACNIQSQAEALLAGSEFEVDSESVLKLVSDTDCSAYDCEFVALAVQLDVRLVTVDKKLLKRFPQRAVSLAWSPSC